MTVAEGSYRVYVNGTLQHHVESTLISSAWIENLIENANLYIGASVYDGDGGFAGNIKDFRVYNMALTADQLATIHADDGVESYVDSGNTYNTNYSGGYSAGLDSNLAARFDFEN